MGVIEVVGPGVSIRQGDIVTFSDAVNRPFQCRAAVILTADCDLAQNKHYGQILFCPMVPITVYFKDAWCRRRLQKMLSNSIEKIRQEFEKASLMAGLPGEVSRSTIEILVKSEEQMQRSLAVMAGLNSRSQELVIKNTRVCIACNRADISQIDCMVEAVSARDTTTFIKAKLSIQSEFRAEMKADSNEVVAIADELSGSNAAAVVLLRCPFSLSSSDISTENKNAEIRRVARFSQPVKYLVAQKFGFLFSRFGMPSNIEADRDTAVDMETLDHDA